MRRGLRRWAGVTLGGVTLVLLSVLGGRGAVSPAPPAPLLQVHDGVRVTVGLAERRRAGPVRPGGPADLEIRIEDAASGLPLPGLHPAAWVSPASGDQRPDREACAQRIRALGQAGLSTQAATSLNQSYLYMLHADASLSVLNPLLACQRTRLADLVSLAGAPTDAVPGFDPDTLYVSLPQAAPPAVPRDGSGAIAIVDTLTNRSRAYLAIDGAPGALAREPGGAQVWVTVPGRGWAVVDTLEEKVVATLPGQPEGDRVVFHPDGGRAYLADGRRLVAMDTATRTEAAVRRLDAPLTHLAHSPLAGALVAADASGTVLLIDAGSLEPRQSLAVASDAIDALGVDPSGRWAVAVAGGRAALVDTATARVRGTVEVPVDADEVVFTEGYAYVGGTAAETAAVLPLAPLDGGAPLSVTVIQTGRPFGEGVKATGSSAGARSTAPTPATPRRGVSAPSLLPLVDGDGFLFARPVDRTLLTYVEGMNAPVGGMGTSSPTPARGLLHLPRQLREVTPGVHCVGVTLPAGRYDLSVLLEAPRTAVCFALDLGGTVEDGPPVTRMQPPRQSVASGSESEVRFSLARDATPLGGQTDVRVLFLRPGSNWQRHVAAEVTGDAGYVARVRFSQPGEHQALVASPSLGLSFGDVAPVTVLVRAPDEVYAQRLRGMDGREVSFDALIAGKVAVVNAFYTSCAEICPMMAATLRGLADHLGEKLGTEVVLVSLSLDPTTDTPQRLQTFSSLHGGRAGWHFLTGERTHLVRLTDRLGLGGGAKEAHSPLLVLSAPTPEASARVWTRASGFGDPAALASQVAALARGE